MIRIGPLNCGPRWRWSCLRPRSRLWRSDCASISSQPMTLTCLSQIVNHSATRQVAEVTWPRLWPGADYPPQEFRVNAMLSLTRIFLHNWHRFDHCVIDVKDSLYLAGHNGSGKSSLLDAIQLVLVAN